MAIRKAAGYKRDGEREKRGERERECQSKLSIRAKDELRKGEASGSGGSRRKCNSLMFLASRHRCYSSTVPAHKALAGDWQKWASVSRVPSPIKDH